MSGRFDNISTADLIAREAETRAEAYDLLCALRERLVAEAKAKIEIGSVYRVSHGRFAGRKLLVKGIGAGVAGLDLRGRNPWVVFAWGRLNGKSAAGDGWTIRPQNVGVDRLVKL
ncbi:hypothetical protein [Pararhizobium haloflavum]|uniref:hypothetical protein n=1 Tax=Pararhizobium haloflavum TaxID=2037914 RepID=UPI000C1A1781|nr:hypothetical protein [Pararhizobium haloflavum]